MPATPIHRSYPVRSSIDFTDFWDICGHFARIHLDFPLVYYTVKSAGETIIDTENDVSHIISVLNNLPPKKFTFIAIFYPSDDALENEEPSRAAIEKKFPTVRFSSESSDKQVGVSSPRVAKYSLFEFEEMLLEKYGRRPESAEIKFGEPCEVIAAFVDLRGFSTFCEQPNIESPYTCGLMYAFYQNVQNCFRRYPPDMFKYMGDGVLAVWETGMDDRETAVASCLEGAISLDSQWKITRKTPQFTHGSPEDTAIGIAFGLASKLPHIGDYIGRPINIASRLCSVCPPREIFTDKAVPSVPPGFPRIESTAHIKSFGRYFIYRTRAD